MLRKLSVALLLSALLTSGASASIIFTITPTATNIADIEVTGSVNATTGSYNAPTASLRGARFAFLTSGLLGSGTSLWTTTGGTAAWTTQTPLPGASTLLTSAGAILSTGSASVGTIGGNGANANKIVMSMSGLAPVAGQTITGRVTGFTLPNTWTWGAIGATGALFYGQDNSANAMTNTGTWVIAVPEIVVSGNGNTILDGDLAPSLLDFTDFGATPIGTPIQRIFRVDNTGAATLTTSGLTLPSGYSLVEGLSPSIGAGLFDTFTVQLNALAEGTYSGQISFTNNDASENPFNFAITGSVFAPEPSSIVLATLSAFGFGFVVWRRRRRS